jgi:hypothetical protein
MRGKRQGRRGARVLLLLALVLAAIAAGSSGATAATDPSSPAVPVAHPAVSLQGPASGAAAVEALGTRIADVAGAYGWTKAQLISRLSQDPSLNVDKGGYLFYTDPALSENGVAATPGSAAAGSEGVAGPSAAARSAAPALAALGDTFKLHSLPGAAHIVYLDFTGYTLHADAWTDGYNNGNDIVAPPYDTDGNPASFSDAELTAIQHVWQRVAEDYAPFNVDVTTEFMGESYLTRSSTTDNLYGMRVLISPISSYIGNYGGMAYVGVFNAVGDYSKTALVFPENLGGGSEKDVGEAASHENGHTLGLAHQGTTGGVEYYPGQGGGETGWAPIMGVGYNKNLSQWSKGEYSGANNTEDEIAIMGTYGAAGRTDDVGNTTATATYLGTTGTRTGSGIIGSSGDADVFRVSWAAGPLSIGVAPAALGPDLDILLDVLDSGGNVIATDNPADLLMAATTLNVTAGNYYIRVRGTGKGNPLVDGYSSYGSLGAYTISVMNTDGRPAKAAGVTATATSSSTIDLGWTDNATNETGYYVSRWNAATSNWDVIGDAGANATSYTDDGLSASTSYTYRVGPHNGYGVTWSDASAPATTYQKITIVSPNGEEAWQVGSVQHIRWSVIPTIPTVDLDVSRDGGNTWEVIQYGVADTGDYTWTATGPVSSTCLAFVGDPASGYAIAGMSDRYFSIVQAPTVTGLSPTRGSTTGGTSVVITGTNFSGVMGVSFGGASATSFLVNSPTQITATTPTHAAGTVEVVVTSDGGSSATAGTANDFTYVTPPPTVTSLNPATGSNAGGTTVTITGTNFLGATAVTFGGSPASTFAVISTAQIRVTAPAHAVGTVNVQVTTPGGASATTGTGDDYTYAIMATRFDQTHSFILKSGTWADFTAPAAWSGSYGRSATAGAFATIYFNGTRLDWIAMKGITTGVADVYLDGTKVTTVNLGAAAASYQQMVYTTGTLASGSHNVKLVRSTASAAGKYLTLDDVDIWGTISAPPVTLTRYEQSNTAIKKAGTWANYTSTPSSGGSYGRSATASASAIIYFTGTRLDYIGMKGTTTGYAEIWLDGVKVTGTSPINLYSSPAAYRRTIWTSGTLAYGPHTVKIVRSTASAAGKYLTLDAVDIWGTIKSGP